MKRVLAGLLGLLPGMAAAADPSVRMGQHDGFGRVVWEFDQSTAFKVERTGDTVVLRFAAGGAVPDGSGKTTNVVAVHGGDGVATVQLAPGAVLRTSRLGNRVVLDATRPKPARAKPAPSPPPPPAPSPVLRLPDPAVATRPPLPADAPVAQAAPVVPVIEAPPRPEPAPIAAEPAVPPPVPAPPAAPPPPAAEPVSLAARPAAPPEGVVGTGILLPFGPRTGAAAFRRGAEAWVVFDEGRPVDLATVATLPAFAGAVVQALPDATLLRLKLPEGQEIRLHRDPAGWLVSVGTGGPPQGAAMPVPDGDRMRLPVAAPGSSLAVPDAETGGVLLVGTARTGTPGVPVGVRVPGFTVLPSFQGVVIDPRSDRTTLRPLPDSFAAEDGAPMSPPQDAMKALAEASFLTRRFAFPTGTPEALMRRLQGEVAAVAEAPVQSRIAPRRLAAQTMIALGLGAEAHALLRLAVKEDPRAASDPDTNGLAAIAALLAGRTAEADGLADPALDGTDEVALWRAIRTAAAEPHSAAAAAIFAADAKLALAYPPALRDRLLPVVAETMATGGAGPAVDALLASRPGDPALLYARALREEAKGDTAAALASLDTLAAGHDRWVGSRAAVRAIRLRRASGALDAKAGAEALERNFYAWRGDDRERDIRLQAADWRAEAGQWRAALDGLREAEALFPDSAAAIRARRAAVLNDLVAGPAGRAVAPVELIALAEENAELVARAAPAATAALLADKLVALDLPNRAGPVLDRMMGAAPPGEGRAALGARLAAIRLAEGDGSGTQAALSASDAPDLPPPLAEERGLLRARALAKAGDVPGATAVLAALGSPAADDLRASVLADAKDWAGAQAALSGLVSRSLPSAGPLSPAQQDLVLRLASAASRNGDDAALRGLARSTGARLDGPRADMFRLLTAAPVSGVGDLKRSGGEMALARAVPQGVAAVGTR